MEKVKPIILKDSDKGLEYTLEFNRESVKFAESKGFSFDDLDNFPMSKTEELFYYAFRMHHKKLSKEKTDSIFYDCLGGHGNLPDGFIKRLVRLYILPFDTLSADDSEEAGENFKPKMTVEM